MSDSWLLFPGGGARNIEAEDRSQDVESAIKHRWTRFFVNAVSAHKRAIEFNVDIITSQRDRGHASFVSNVIFRDTMDNQSTDATRVLLHFWKLQIISLGYRHGDCPVLAPMQAYLPRSWRCNNCQNLPLQVRCICPSLRNKLFRIFHLYLWCSPQTRLRCKNPIRFYKRRHKRRQRLPSYPSIGTRSATWF